MTRIKALLALSLVPLLRPTAAANADEHGIAVADKRGRLAGVIEPQAVFSQLSGEENEEAQPTTDETEASSAQKGERQ